MCGMWRWLVGVGERDPVMSGYRIFVVVTIVRCLLVLRCTVRRYASNGPIIYMEGVGQVKAEVRVGMESCLAPTYLPTSYPSSSVGSPSWEKIKPRTPEVTPEFQIFRGALFPEVESVRECPQSYRNVKILKIPGSYGIPIS